MPVVAFASRLTVRRIDLTQLTELGPQFSIAEPAELVMSWGKGTMFAKLVIGLKDRKIFEAADGSVVGGIGCSPGRATRYVQPAPVGQRVPGCVVPGHSAIDDILQFLTPRSGLGKGYDSILFGFWLRWM